jgi:hypothetical protein
MVVGGHPRDIINNTMDNHQSPKEQKLRQIIKLLNFLLTLDDLEIIKSTLESVIELLQEENNQSS